MLPTVLLILIGVTGVLFFTAFVRAARFARRHEDKLTGIVDRSTWWLRLFAKNGYGAEVEQERKRLALQWLVTVVLFFLVAGLGYNLGRPG